jgi:ABC-type nitrate/sulfonate/bicarbonate transport system permease component
MYKRSRQSISVILALVAGFIFASIGTSISYPCSPSPDDPSAKCVSFQKALMHLNDLARNTQGSLTRFLINFLVGLAIFSALIIAFNKIWTAKEARQ